MSFLAKFVSTSTISVFKSLDDRFASSVDNETDVDDTECRVKNTKYRGGDVLWEYITETDG